MASPVNLGLNCTCPSHNDNCCPRVLRIRWCCIGVDDAREDVIKENLETMIETAVKRASVKSDPIDIPKIDKDKL